VFAERTVNFGLFGDNLKVTRQSLPLLHQRWYRGGQEEATRRTFNVHWGSRRQRQQR